MILLPKRLVHGCSSLLSLIKEFSARVISPRSFQHRNIQRSVNQGFTLVELIIVITIIGILAVTAGPRIFGRSGVDEAATEARLLSMLRLQQQRAMQDTAQYCYGAEFSASEARPFDCGVAIAGERVISLPAGTAISGITGAIGFNSLGCPVALNTSALPSAPQACSNSNIEITITGTTTRNVCVQSQGYIRAGAC